MRESGRKPGREERWAKNSSRHGKKHCYTMTKDKVKQGYRFDAASAAADREEGRKDTERRERERERR